MIRSLCIAALLLLLPWLALGDEPSWHRPVRVVADGRFTVSASRDGTLRVWDLDTGQPVSALNGHPAVVVQP